MYESTEREKSKHNKTNKQTIEHTYIILLLKENAYIKRLEMLKKSALLSIAAAASAEYAGLPQTWDELHKLNGGGGDDSLIELFVKYKETYKKTYATDSVENFHFKIFAQRVKGILDFNTAGQNTYKKGITRFADMSADMRRSYIMEETMVSRSKSNSTPQKLIVPKSKPLANAGVGTFCDLSQFATSVKDQVSEYT